MAKKIGLGFLVLFFFAIAAFLLFQRQIGQTLFTRAVETVLANDVRSDLEDGLHVALCGTGSPMPNIERAGPCNLVIAGDQMFVVDVGEGGGRNIALMGFNVAQANALLLSHFHSDHIDGLGPLMLFHWTRGASTAPLPVYGPSGVESVVDGFNAAYATDDTYRVAHHGEEVVPPAGGGSVARPFEMPATSAIVYDQVGVTITAFAVNHAPVEPAVGYRFDYKGRSVCFSGDTVRSGNLEAACKGVDLLVHEALDPDLVSELERVSRENGNTNAATIFADILDYHATPEDAADSAQAAGAKMLVYSHLVPALPTALLYPTFIGDAESRFDGEIVVGEDGMMFSMPANGETIRPSELM